MSTAHVLGDWGTSRLRLYRISGGAVTGRLDGPGIGTAAGSASAVLADRLGQWLAEGPLESVTLCGMAGARGALVEAGYAPCPASRDDWLRSRSRLNVASLPVAVLPGLSCRSGGVPDVMRGEETQIFGALSLHPELARGEHVIALPGTHCKWVRLRDGAVEAFSTWPTGEFFALLSEQSTLTGQPSPGSGTFDDGFERGLARRGDPVMTALFEARAARMLDGKSREWSRGLLSGLLIAAELAALSDAESDVALIGEPELVALYERALAQSGRTARRIDAEAAVIAGLELARGAERKDKP